MKNIYLDNRGNREGVTVDTLLPDTRKESDLERKFTASCRRYGGIARKLVSPGNDGVTDRFVVWNHGVTTYAELKRPNGKGAVSKLQSDELEMLQRMGHLAMVVESEMDIALFIKRSMARVMEREHFTE